MRMYLLILLIPADASIRSMKCLLINEKHVLSSVTWAKLPCRYIIYEKYTVDNLHYKNIYHASSSIVNPQSLSLRLLCQNSSIVSLA
ncbi:hypothetical protein V1525DRAFT_396518 [Lipomyces kononenkoae]|uniref:Uncharacterized protein n=1 Tax=Lipomyces kononenkoae TaxID=34357 RepID=A0ACC3T7Q2_LIPKO